MYTQLYNHFHDTAQFANWAESWFREMESLFVIVVIFLFILVLGDSLLAQKVNFLACSKSKFYKV